MEKMKVKIDKELDLLTAYSKEYENNNSELEVINIEELNILLHVNPLTKEVVFVQIYDFSIIKRKLVRHLTFLVTKNAIRNWINTIIESFKANPPRERFA